MRRRFFVDKFESGRAELRGDAAQHLGRVLRAEPGQLYELSDGTEVWLARVDKIPRGRAGGAIEFALTEKVPAANSLIEIKLLLSIVKFDRMEWCLEKATELGVSEIVLLAAARSEKALIQAAAKRCERWKKILLESAQQSRRLRPPALTATARADAAFGAANENLKIIFSERVTAQPMGEIVQRVSGQEVCIAIGPEGGWTDGEFSDAAKSGFQEASLGREILRTETAVIAALVVVRYALEKAAP